MDRLFTKILLIALGLGLAKKGFSEAFPDELITPQGKGLGFYGSGVAGVRDLSNIEVNPALLSLEKNYIITGGYSSPATGQDFYDVGIVDSFTSDFALAASYRGYEDKDPSELEAGDVLLPVERRMALAIARTYGDIAIGLNLNYTQANLPEGIDIVETGIFTGGMGLSGLINPNLRWGLSANRVVNHGYSETDPTTYRAGLSYQAHERVLVLLDYSLREKVDFYQGDLEGETEDENRVHLGSVITLGQGMKVFNSIGYGLTNGKKISGAAGLAVAGKNWEFAVGGSRPDFSENRSYAYGSLTVVVKQ